MLKIRRYACSPFNAESNEPTQVHHYFKLNMIPIIIFQMLVVHGEDERASSRARTRRRGFDGRHHRWRRGWVCASLRGPEIKVRRADVIITINTNTTPSSEVELPIIWFTDYSVQHALLNRTLKPQAGNQVTPSLLSHGNYSISTLKTQYSTIQTCPPPLFGWYTPLFALRS